MELREALLAGNEKGAAALARQIDRRTMLVHMLYAACHAKDPHAIVFVDSVREALDYFPKNGGQELIERCVSYLAACEKREWEWPREVKYKGDPMKAYIGTLRSRKSEEARFLAKEVLRKVGMNTLGELWVHLSLEDTGTNGSNFVVASACRRSLPFIGATLQEPLLWWASDFLASFSPKSKVETTDPADYEELANDIDTMKRVCLRPGPACANIVFLHRIKQNENHLGRSQTAYLLKRLAESTREAKEMPVAATAKGADTAEDFRITDSKYSEREAFRDLESALKQGDLERASASITMLCDGSLDDVCVALLKRAATVGKPDDPQPLVVTHAACEIARTMGTDAHMPLVQAVYYLQGAIERARQ